MDKTKPWLAVEDAAGDIRIAKALLMALYEYAEFDASADRVMLGARSQDCSDVVTAISDYLTHAEEALDRVVEGLARKGGVNADTD